MKSSLWNAIQLANARESLAFQRPKRGSPAHAEAACKREFKKRQQNERRRRRSRRMSRPKPGDVVRQIREARALAGI